MNIPQGIDRRISKNDTFSYRVSISLARQRVISNWKSCICVLSALAISLSAFSLEAETKSIAIIGAGPSGLVTAKSALEIGFIPTVFEKSEDIGGIWHPQLGATWNSLSTNLSRFSCMFSDFPWSSEVCMFPNQFKMFQYLEQYAKQFGIFSYIRTSTEVLQVQYISWRNQWKITWRDSKNSQTDFFDFVAVCSGFFPSLFIQNYGLIHFLGK